MNKKRPIFTLENAHLNNSWVLSAGNIKNSDLLCTGSYDGCINFYKLNKDEKKIEVLKRLEGFPGCINNLKFSHAKNTEFN